MSILEIKGLRKHFKVLNRREGLVGSFKDLFSRNYRIVKAVDDISFSINEGEIVGFLGPNGAGKSTTIKMLIGVLKPTSGTCVVNGLVPFLDRISYVKDIGIVLGQRTQLWWDLPVIESYKLLRDIYEIPEADYQENLAIFDDLLGLSELYMKPVRSLSLGQRMLCDIAASFLHNPKIIFLDEPTIGLDVAVKNKVRKLIKELNRVKKTTIVLTSHDVGDIETLSERIILIDKGALLYDGEVTSFNKIFGSYRTVKFTQNSVDMVDTDSLTDLLGAHFSVGDDKLIPKAEDSSWHSITVDEDKFELTSVLDFLLKELSIKDIKMEEIEMEAIIERVYNGALK